MNSGRSKQVQIGAIVIGGGAPVTVQSMLSVHHSDVEGNVRQAVELERAGCEIVRVAVPCMEAVRLIPAIKEAVSMPLVADIHFDYKLALESVAAGVDKVRINPGNIGDFGRVRQVVAGCKQKNIPIRVGVNSGSVEKEILARHGAPTAAALCESAFSHVELIERCDYDNIVISIKSSNLRVMVEACRMAAARCNYPLHLGVTEAGTRRMGTIKSAAGMGALLLEGIGDTIRVSLTGDALQEIPVALDLLRAVGLRKNGVEVISCPTCGRTEIDLAAIAERVEAGTRHIQKPLTVAVMGCVVNGPGEASTADIGIAGGQGSAVLFRAGQVVRKLTGDIAAQLIEEIELL